MWFRRFEKINPTIAPTIPAQMITVIAFTKLGCVMITIGCAKWIPATRLKNVCIPVGLIAIADVQIIWIIATKLHITNAAFLVLIMGGEKENKILIYI